LRFMARLITDALTLNHLLQTCSQGVSNSLTQSSHLQASVFNQRMLEFEPTLEEWPVSVEISFTLSGQNGTEEGAHLPVGSQGAGIEGGGNAETWVHSIHVHSQHLLNMNLTEHQMNKICTTLLAWRTDLDGLAGGPEGQPAPTTASLGAPAMAKGTKQATKYCAYRISNRSGLPLRISSTLSQGHTLAASAGSSQYVAPMDCQALCFIQDMWRKHPEAKSAQRRQGGSHQHQRVLNLSVALLQELPAPSTIGSAPVVAHAADAECGSMGGQDEAHVLAPEHALASFLLPLLLDAHQADTKVRSLFTRGA
jgi:hypothetical protein